MNRHFIRHYAEMVVAMFAGMLVLGLPAEGLLQLAGYSSAQLWDDAPALGLLGMATVMTIPMVWLMRRRGHGWQPCWEMSASMFAPTLLVIALMGAGAIGFGLAMSLEHALMLPAMLLVMLMRREEYSGCHVHGHRVTTTREAQAERTTASILDAVERLLAQGTALNMLAIAGEAGVSRPTLYARYKSVGEIVEAVVERSVIESMASFEAARPTDGPAPAALERMLAASSRELSRFQGLVRGAHEHMSPGAVHRTHAAMIAPLEQLARRGQREGTFRTDLPAEWLVSMYFALVHGAEDHASTHGADRAETLRLLQATARAVFVA